MNHPMLVAALATDHCRQCPCGAATQQQGSLCRRCQATTTWRRETVQMMSRRAKPSWTRGRTAWARLLAWMASLLHNISKGAEN
jgi:hypothetical protein